MLVVKCEKSCEIDGVTEDFLFLYIGFICNRFSLYKIIPFVGSYVHTVQYVPSDCCLEFWLHIYFLGFRIFVEYFVDY